jgi:hypothetical protein
MIIKELQERIANLEAIVIEEESAARSRSSDPASRAANQPAPGLQGFAAPVRTRSPSAWQKRNSQQDQSPAIFRLNDRQAGPFPAPS